MNRGMLTRTGQPSTQYGFGHWRQRSASSIASWSVSPSATSRKLTARRCASCSGMATRSMPIRSFWVSAGRGSVIGQPPRCRGGRRQVRVRGAVRPPILHASRRSIAACSNERYVASRSASSRKSTRWPSNSGPSTQANFVSPSRTTRQPPHIPVPSTMIAFRTTVVGTANGRVSSLTARIIGTGPTA